MAEGWGRGIRDWLTLALAVTLTLTLGSVAWAG